MFELPKHIAVENTIINSYSKPKTFIIFDKCQFESNQRKNLKMDKWTEKLLHFGLKGSPSNNGFLTLKIWIPSTAPL